MSHACRANVAWALGSLANESEENRRSIGSIPEAMNALVKVACCSSDEARERAAYSIAEVVRDNEENRVSLANTEGSIAALVHICATGSDPGKEQVLRAEGCNRPDPCLGCLGTCDVGGKFGGQLQLNRPDPVLPLLGPSFALRCFAAGLL